MRKKIKSLIGLFLAAVLCLTACGSDAGFTDEAVMKIDGQEIMKSEYMVYLYTTSQSFVAAVGEDVWSMDFDGQTADELVEERTISTLQSVIAAKEYAEANGISLTDEEKEQAKLAAEQFVSGVSEEDLMKMGVDAEKVVPLMESSYLYTLVYAAIAAECDVDAAEMEAYYQENKAQMQGDYAKLRVQTILLDDSEKAAEAAERAKAGEDILALFEEYDVAPYAEDGGEITGSQSYLQTKLSISEELEVGDVIGPVQMGEGWFVLKVMEKTLPADEEVKELAESDYRIKVQAAYTEARFAEMMKPQTVKKYPEVWETLEKFH